MSQKPDKVIYTMMSVGKYYEKKPVLQDISLGYFYGAKIGVIGLNGSGKSSLLRIMAGVDKAYVGQTILSPGYSIGFLEQEPQLDESKTVREMVEEGVSEIVSLLKEFESINEQFSQPMSDKEMNALLERQGKVQEKLDDLGAGIWIAGWRWAWMPCVARPGILPCACFPAGNAGGWPSAAFSCGNPTSFSSTNPRTISTPRP